MAEAFSHCDAKMRNTEQAAEVGQPLLPGGGIDLYQAGKAFTTTFPVTYGWHHQEGVCSCPWRKRVRHGHELKGEKLLGQRLLEVPER